MLQDNNNYCYKLLRMTHQTCHLSNKVLCFTWAGIRYRDSNRGSGPFSEVVECEEDYKF